MPSLSAAGVQLGQHRDLGLGLGPRRGNCDQGICAVSAAVQVDVGSFLAAGELGVPGVGVGDPCRSGQGLHNGHLAALELGGMHRIAKSHRLAMGHLLQRDADLPALVQAQVHHRAADIQSHHYAGGAVSHRDPVVAVGVEEDHQVTGVQPPAAGLVGGGDLQVARTQLATLSAHLLEQAVERVDVPVGPSMTVRTSHAARPWLRQRA